MGKLAKSSLKIKILKKARVVALNIPWVLCPVQIHRHGGKGDVKRLHLIA